MIKSFRGRLEPGTQDEIRLSTNNGMIGYRIVKFQVISALPFQAADEHVLKISKFSQEGAIDATIDFNDPTLLAVGIINNESAGYRYAINSTVVFDHVKVNQDIYISHTNTDGTSSCNYYIELEQMKLNTDEATVATLKDMRGRD
jgi:hypothetical protein